jgi:hypothetical protein
VLLLSSPGCKGAAAFSAALATSHSDTHTTIPSSQLPPPLLTRGGVQFLSLLAPQDATSAAALLTWRSQTYTFARSLGADVGGLFSAAHRLGWPLLWHQAGGVRLAAACRECIGSVLTQPGVALRAVTERVGEGLLRSGLLPRRLALTAPDQRLRKGGDELHIWPGGYHTLSPATVLWPTAYTDSHCL